MRALRAVVASLLLACSARAASVTVRIQETVVIEMLGATAAYTTNPDVADVKIVRRGELSVIGHSAGQTQLMVITGSGTQAFLITVAATSVARSTRPEAGTPVTRYEGRYSSGAARVQNTVDVVSNEGSRRSEFHILHIHHLDAAPDELSDGIGSIFYRHVTPDHELTLFDDLVDVSRMTISNAQVRGIHLTQGALELHAGYASPTMYDDVFLPVDHRWVAGAGYAFDVRSTRLTPSLYGFFSDRADSARRGVVAALTAEHRDGDTLYMRGDVGISRSLAASGEIRYGNERNQARASMFYKPADFPTLGLGDLPGTHAELDTSHRATDRLSLTTHGTYDRLRLAAFPQTIANAGFGFGYALTTRLALSGGADLSTVRTPTASIRTVGIPVSATYEAPGFGFAASYRLLEHSAASRRGDAVRLSAHAGAGRFNASVWADRQRNAPTLELIFRAEPGLDLALLRLGIAVRNPEDVARALRDNATLIDLGYITGVNVDLTPQRMQAGLNLSWLGKGQRGDHLRLVGIYSRDEGIRTTRDSMIGTLTYSRRILAATDLYCSYSWYRTNAGLQQESGTAIDLGVRQQLNGMPGFLQRGGSIEGFAFLDPEMSGMRGEGAAPLVDLEITLDGTLTVRTDDRGAYAFARVKPGKHRVVAQLPASPRAFFTTPSHAETNGPARVNFGVVRAAARIDGRVMTVDAATGVSGVVLSATVANGVAITATSDAEGAFVFVVPPGTFRIALAARSLPAGYAIAGQIERDVTVEADQPQSMTFEVQARRSISGRAAGASEVRIDSLGRTAPVDAQGNFLFRSMPAGTFTLTAKNAGHAVSRIITLPAQPTMIGGVVLMP